jgi:hypothetical protein
MGEEKCKPSRFRKEVGRRREKKKELVQAS